MPTFLERQQLGTNTTWRSRCEIAGVIAATEVQSEPGSVTGHEKRSEYAYKFLNSPATMSGPLAMAVASQPGISGSEATDQDIQFTVNSLWDAMSGNSPATPAP